MFDAWLIPAVDWPIRRYRQILSIQRAAEKCQDSEDSIEKQWRKGCHVFRWFYQKIYLNILGGLASAFNLSILAVIAATVRTSAMSMIYRRLKHLWLLLSSIVRIAKWTRRIAGEIWRGSVLFWFSSCHVNIRIFYPIIPFCRLLLGLLLRPLCSLL